jgi:hypothetical protein
LTPEVTQGPYCKAISLAQISKRHCIDQLV